MSGRGADHNMPQYKLFQPAFQDVRADLEGPSIAADLPDQYVHTKATFHLETGTIAFVIDGEVFSEMTFTSFVLAFLLMPQRFKVRPSSCITQLCTVHRWTARAVPVRCAVRFTHSFDVQAN